MNRRAYAVLAFLGDRRGAAVVEFALIVPALLILYLVGFDAAQAVAAYRKLSAATVELANVTAQYTTMSATDVSNVFNASSQVMAPFPTSNLKIVLTEIKTDSSGNASVYWSRAYNGGSPLTTVSVPAGIVSPNTNYILVQTTYSWTPPVSFGSFGTVPMSDQIYMLPRQSSSIPYTG
jgi:Flp pilus assembly protein TadG